CSGQRLDDLRRGRCGPALLEARQVVDRDAGEVRQLFSAQAACPAVLARRHPDRCRRDPVAPLPHQPPEFAIVHLLSLALPAPPVLVLLFLRRPRTWLAWRRGRTIDA